MAERNVAACIITGSDPHGSEYPLDCWKTRQWISGFTGSAGTVVLTSDKACLWTDGRYWLQASKQLKGSGIELMKDGHEKTPSLEEWLSSCLSEGDTVGFDGSTVSARAAAKWESFFKKHGIKINSSFFPWDELWTDRPGLPESPVYELTPEESGESRRDRLQRLREHLSRKHADVWVGTAMDAAAWLLNIRGGDVPYSPVAAGFIIVQPQSAQWFCNRANAAESVCESLKHDGVQVLNYNDFYAALASLDAGSVLLADSSQLSRQVINSLPEGLKVLEETDPIMSMKARKNSVEKEQIGRAMEKDGAALVRFFVKLENLLNEGREIDEVEAGDLLYQCRSEFPGFFENSFSTIAGLDANGAVVHYSAQPESAGVLRKGSGLFLLDSGGQWKEGTTDITRTVSLGSPSKEQIRDYTLVLKGHIALACARFPKGTRGYQLDTLARQPLWTEGLNYGHGTGHGVGFRLNVHEGPERISPHPVDVALEEGMVVSDEPGLYREGLYGIRIENLMICREDLETEFGAFLAFDTLTLAPYDQRLINVPMLTEAERAWVNSYHREVRSRLLPLVSSEESTWLIKATEPLDTDGC